MKFKSLLQFVLVVLAGQFLFACSTAEYYRFASVKPETYHKSVAKADPVEAPAAAPAEAEAPAPAEALATEPEPVLEASTAAPVPVLFETKKVVPAKAPVATQPTLSADESTVLEAAKTRLSAMSKAEKKEFKKEVKKVLRETNEVGTVVKVILAILLPPLAVFLHEGLGSRFWISLLLTLLLFLPGVIYALLVVTDSI
ncbi:YqaE/Pmp3 family membrane protein [Rufibacter psychrotolerans]|uniref:YqaE/Pmp3 family membrane protein n=1 Tax=Rufibacter psychrotolerans TaxID=2812556 RepID=UPI001F07CCCD|nr:YqaE/Pmp3 family membrane protein [Rufibacter sp. SYSU D00308]